VKTQAIASYREFGVSSRRSAIVRMHELGLLPTTDVGRALPGTRGGFAWISRAARPLPARTVEPGYSRPEPVAAGSGEWACLKADWN
jgi:hypothetical protein